MLLAIHVALAFNAVLNRSVTSDEPGHLTAGYAYWTLHDYRLQPENGNLPQRWGAVPLLAARPHFEPKPKSGDWEASRVWQIADTFLFANGNNTDFLLLCARTSMLAWSLAAGLLVFAWARALWGDSAGIGALACFVVSPTMLAHGPLVTSDMAAAVCLLGAAAAWWRLCRIGGARWIAIAGLATGLAAVAKFSAALLMPTYAGLVVIAVAMRVVDEGRHVAVRAALRLAGRSALAGLVAWLVIWTFFGFRYWAANPQAGGFAQFYVPWETVVPSLGAGQGLMQYARRLHALPEAFLFGFSYVTYFSAERGAFLAGSFSATGWWWFFPFAFAVKSTLGELAITALLWLRAVPGLAHVRRSHLRQLAGTSLVPLLGFALVFGSFAVASHLNIGHRHILPLYLVLFILAGALFAASAPRWVRVAALVALAASAVESGSNHPDHLAFFNRLAGGPGNGWRLLVDSSLDWGQDVPALAQWIRHNRRADEPVFYSCFGTANPAYEGVPGEMLSPYFSLGQPRRWFALRPGLYCISATMLQDPYGLRPGPWTADLERDYQRLRVLAPTRIASGAWSTELPALGFHPEYPLWLLDRLRFARLCQYLRLRKPEAVIHHTQFVFRLTPDEVETVVDRPFSALLTAMERASSAAQ